MRYPPPPRVLFEGGGGVGMQVFSARCTPVFVSRLLSGTFMDEDAKVGSQFRLCIFGLNKSAKCLLPGVELCERHLSADQKGPEKLRKRGRDRWASVAGTCYKSFGVKTIGDFAQMIKAAR